MKKILIDENDKNLINLNNLSDYLGVKKFKYGEIESENKIGIVTGLAWTEFGRRNIKN